jgi:hypothetical protein
MALHGPLSREFRGSRELHMLMREIPMLLDRMITRRETSDSSE